MVLACRQTSTETNYWSFFLPVNRQQMVQNDQPLAIADALFPIDYNFYLAPGILYKDSQPLEPVLYIQF